VRHALLAILLLVQSAVFYPRAILAAPPNLISLRLRDGAGELEWISPCSFRVARYWGQAPPPAQPVNPEAVSVSRTDLDAALRFKTECLAVDVEKATLRLQVNSATGMVMADAAPPARTPEGFVVERASPDGEQYFGLGPRATPEANLRGQRIMAAKPLLLSSLGYGESFPLGGACVYDLARTSPGRRRISIRGPDHLEYLFCYGPTPREILMEHARIMGAFVAFDSKAFGILDQNSVPGAATRIATHGAGSWKSLEESVRSVVHMSWSGLLVGALDFSPYDGATGPLFTRAAQLAGLFPILYLSAARRPAEVYRPIAEWRKQLEPYLFSCAFEARQLGIPMVRPIAMQSPGDLAAAAADTSAFMLGDALLVAPVFDASGSRSLYLPAGTWTRLSTHQVYKGRRTIQLQAGRHEIPLFVKHTSVLPLASREEPGPWRLHYFAGFAAECLLMEESAEAVSQFHAAPAGDLLRLEILSARQRTYEWVIRHLRPPGRVTTGGKDLAAVDSPEKLKPQSWLYDRTRGQLHIRCVVPAGGEQVIQVIPFTPQVLTARPGAPR